MIIYKKLSIAGSVSDISAFQYTDFFIALKNNLVDLPPNSALPGTNTFLPYSFIGDENFHIEPFMMRPFSRGNGLDERQRTFNYR